MQKLLLVIFAAVATAGSVVAAGPLSKPSAGTELVMCGDHKVLIVNADKALASGRHTDGVVWEYDVWNAASATGMTQTKLDHISDCKITAEGNLLLTSSYGWCMIVERATKKILFYTPSTPNAHSAAVLPGGLIAVASSTGEVSNGYSSIHLFKPGLPGAKVASYPLDSAHGAYWDAAEERLFTIGGRTLQAYRYDKNAPSLTLDYEVTTALSGTHDLTPVGEGKLCISGKESYIYDIDQKSFRAQPLFHDHTAVKSVNINPATGEMWYTDAIDGDGTETWSTRTVRWASDRLGTALRTFKVTDQDIYKVRPIYKK